MKIKVYYIFLVFAFVSFSVKANHIVGGHVGMYQKNNTPGLYTFQLNLYLNNNNIDEGGLNALTSNGFSLAIFRKRDNRQLDFVPIEYKRFEKVIYNNVACEKSLNISAQRYIAEVDKQLDISLYDDPEGYYFGYARCCREEKIINLVNPGISGLVFLSSFPPLTQFPNYSSPVIPTLEGVFVCASSPFAFDFIAEDLDGDKLEYEFVTPIKGSNTPSFEDRTLRPGPWEEMTWQSPWSLQNIIIGERNLAIDRNSGRITLKTSKTGIFSFTIQVKKIRNGVVIGFTNMDYQITIAYCPEDGPPQPELRADGKLTNRAFKCLEEPILLETGDNNEWTHLWLYNGDIIRDEDLNRYIADSLGNFQVLRNFRDKCAPSSFSRPITIQQLNLEAPIVSKREIEICKGTATDISVANSKIGYSYKWNNQFSGSNIGNIKDAGWYVVNAIDSINNCPVGKDSLLIKHLPSPPDLKLSGEKGVICGNDTISLSLDIIGESALWLKNDVEFAKGVRTIKVTEAGLYYAIVENDDGCSSISNNLTISKFEDIEIVFDPIGPLCEGTAPINLNASPQGGIFFVNAIENTRLTPTYNPNGTIVNYTYSNEAGCKVEKELEVQIYPALQLSIPPEYRISAGNEVLLNLAVNQEDVSFEWLPPTFLNDPTIQKPSSMATQNTTYSVKVSSVNGCFAEAETQVIVDFVLKIPNAFSPNNDGINDEWFIPDLLNIYPKASVRIFNNWGEEIYLQEQGFQMWDGNYKNEIVPLGVYTYQIVTNRNNLVLTGRILVIN